jgi:asparagine synthase (glutamine-hydrolysing)
MEMDQNTREKITNILTLRYSPSKNYLLPKLNSIDYSPKLNENYEQKTENLLKNSITKFVEKEKPKNISIALSGGIDSILVLTLFKELYPEIDVFALSFGFDETDYDVQKAQEISHKFDINFEPVFFENFMNNLPEQISIVQEPKINYYWYSVAKKAKEKSNIMFTGDGSDELFGGYVFRYSKFLELIDDSFSWKDKVKSYLECHNRDWVPNHESIFGTKINFSWEKIYSIFKPYFDNNLQPLNQVLLADYMGKLMFDWMPSYSKIYSHVNLKGFSPMLDPALIKYTCTIPNEKKYDKINNLGKLVLRNILKTKNVPVNTSKKGFSPNFSLFWENYGQEIINVYLTDARVVRDHWISQNWIDSSIKTINESHDIRYIAKLLHVLSFEIWYRLFITKEMSSKDNLI